MFSRTLVQLVTGAFALAETCSQRVLIRAEGVLPDWVSRPLWAARDNTMALSRRAVWQVVGWLPRSIKNQVGLNLLMSGAGQQMSQQQPDDRPVMELDPGALLKVMGANSNAIQLQMLAQAMRDKSESEGDESTKEAGE